MVLQPIFQMHADATRDRAQSAVIGRFMLDRGAAAASPLGELPLTSVAPGYVLPQLPQDYASLLPVSSPATDAQMGRERVIRRDSGALRSVLNAFAKWGVAGERAATLLGVPKRTYHQWAKYVADGGSLREPLGADTLDRMSYVLGIWKASMILLPDEKAAIKFVTSPNTAAVFGGRSPLDRMLDGRILDLAAVRAQFDGWRGG